MFYEAFMSICKAMGDSKREKNRDRDYNSIANHHMLHSAQYLDQMKDVARRKDEFECILNHMYSHDAMYLRDEDGEITEVISSYKDIENDIIDRYWRV